MHTTDIVPLPADPDPPARKPSRKKRRQNASRSAAEMKIIDYSPEELDKIANMGMYTDDVGPAHVGRGLYGISLEECSRALRDIEVQLKEIDDLQTKTPEDRDRRILLMRVRLDYTSLKTKIADGMVKSKPEEKKEVLHTKTVKSFPSNAAIPPVVMTETMTIKATGTE